MIHAIVFDMKKRIDIYDTTLRDGSQGEGINFSLEDKIRVAQRLDRLGITYIEGGWPGSNPKDVNFFRRMKDVPLHTAKLAAFGATRRPGISADEDPNLRCLVNSGAPVATLFGKCWDFHVIEALNATLEENLAMIADSLAFMKQAGVKEVFFDGEHFFDGFKANRDYALKALKTARDAGADAVILCDTNGGCLPHEVAAIVREVCGQISIPVGIHAHNDGECAVANTLAAVREGASQVQGTMNGYGERCGNANLCSIIPNLELKMDVRCLPEGKLVELREASRYAAEMANRSPLHAQPFVGDSAFAHKGGSHVSAVAKNPGTYEHVNPEAVGNHRRVLVSELSGQANVLWMAKQANIDLSKNTPETKKILAKLKEMEHQGYEFEGAEASFKVLMQKATGNHSKQFKLEGWRVVIERRGENPPVSEATIKLSVNGVPEHTAAEGNGPVNALDKALHKALEQFYPSLKNISLRDYKVRILEGKQGTSAGTRVLITSGDGHDLWGTVGCSPNIIEASWQALVDSVEYKLQQDERRLNEKRAAAASADVPKPSPHPAK
jgi:2-isopropylmalate synthase